MRTASPWSFISEEAEPGLLSTRRRGWRSTGRRPRVLCARGRGDVSALRSQVWGARREGGNKVSDLGRTGQDEGEAPLPDGAGQGEVGEGIRVWGAKHMRGGLRGVGNGSLE